MNLAETLPLAGILAISLLAVGQAADSVEPLLRELPPGVFVDRSTEVPAAQAKAIGRKLGGNIERLTNSLVRVHGRPVQVNVIKTVDEVDAKAVHAGLLKIKSPLFCIRRRTLVVEYVGKDIDAALATKTSYELGLVAKPTSVRYRVTAELATVEKADYMACNLLFNHFLGLRDGTNEQSPRQIRELSKRFTFGHELALRNPKIDDQATKHSLQPRPDDSTEAVASIVYSFGKLPDREGVPFVKLTVDTTVGHTGLQEGASPPAESLIAATPFWPADDPSVVELAERITEGKITNGAKAMAILEWLAPGRNLKYSGKAGSRWGTAKVLKQKFGHCWDFSDCFVTLARAAGVPSRQVAGWLYGGSGHVWAEFYREGKGWQQVDPTGGGKLMCGIYHIPYFTSEDGEMPILYVGMPKIIVAATR